MYLSRLLSLIEVVTGEDARELLRSFIFLILLVC